MGPSSTTTQDIDFSAEALAILEEELPLFQDILVPLLISLQEQTGESIASGLGPLGASTGRAVESANVATRGAATDAELPDVDFAQLLRTLDSFTPVAQNTTRNLSRDLAANVSSAVDPRFAQFLGPEVGSSTSGSPGGLAIGGAAGGAALGIAALII